MALNDLFRATVPVILLGVLAVLLTACDARPPAAALTRPIVDAPNTIIVTSNGWHSSIVIARRDLPSGRIPETADFPRSRFLEFGWGDAEYYPAENPGVMMTLRAALMPTLAVVHVAGLNAEPADFFGGYEVIAVQADDQGFARLVDFIDASFERSGAARIEASGPGLYATSRFYPATDRFHLGNTCNTWTARALATAGLDVRAQGTSSAEALMRQVRALGRLSSSH